MPEKRDLVTHLTISESELEAELKQHLEPEKSGLGSFVTAPTVFNDAKLTIGTSVAHGKRSPGVDDITLTMSRELLSEDIHLQRDVVSSPAFNPQPPGSTPTPKTQTGTTGVTEQYPINSLESFENIDDEKKDCDSENCDGQSKTTTTFWPITTKALKTTKIHQQKMQFLKGLSRTTQRVPSHGSWTPLGKPQTIMQRTTLKSCDSPPICGRNCGVVIDPNGCQSCDCLWRSKNCRSDIECRLLDGQICDFGRCECGPGYEHHQKSGICQKSNAIRHARQRGVAFLHTSPIPPTLLTLDILPSSSLISGRSHHSLHTRQFKYQIADFFNRIRRSTIYNANYKKHRSG